MIKQTRYMFWEYDLCPYMLGAKLSHIKNGIGYPEGYQGMGFKPLKILSGENGRSAFEKLNEIRSRYHTHNRDTKLIYASMAKNLLV